MFYTPMRTLLCMRGSKSELGPDTLGGRIRIYRERHGLNQTDVGDAIGKTQKTVSAWENGTRTPSRTDVQAIADFLRISRSEIERDTVEERDYLRGKVVPVLSWVSAGKLQDPGDLAALQRQAVDEITVYDLGAGEWFALEVKGDSMDRISPEGSRIIVNANDRTPRAGRNYVFSNRGETTYKRFETGPDRLEPFSTNPNNKILFPARDRDLLCLGHVKRTYLDLP